MIHELIQKYVDFWKAEPSYPLSENNIWKLTKLLTKLDETHDITWEFDNCTLYGHFSDPKDEKADSRFIIITNDEYLRLDVRYDLKRKNKYWNRCVYNIDEEYYTLKKSMLYDCLFISQIRDDEEIMDWTEYTLNDTTGEENPISFE